MQPVVAIVLICDNLTSVKSDNYLKYMKTWLRCSGRAAGSGAAVRLAPGSGHRKADTPSWLMPGHSSGWRRLTAAARASDVRRRAASHPTFPLAALHKNRRRAGRMGRHPSVAVVAFALRGGPRPAAARCAAVPPLFPPVGPFSLPPWKSERYRDRDRHLLPRIGSAQSGKHASHPLPRESDSEKDQEFLDTWRSLENHAAPEKSCSQTMVDLGAARGRSR